MRGLWQLSKFVLIGVVIALVSVGLADQPGQMTFDWRGWQIETTAAFVIIIALLSALLLWHVAKLYFWLRCNTARRTERRLRQRQQDGLRLLTTGFNALAGQDLRLATTACNSARKRLGTVPLISWLNAQIAIARHDYKTAGTEFQTLTRDSTAANLGWRGLMADRQFDHRKFLQPATQTVLADKAFARQAYVHEARIAVAARTRDWDNLRQSIITAEQHRALPKPRLRQIEQVMLMLRGQALQLVEPVHGSDQTSQRHSQAKLLLERAYRLAPDFMPAALAYVDALLAAGERAEASKIIAAIWLVKPRLALLKRFIVAYSNETALARLQRFERFALKRADDADTQIALAELSLAAELYGKAHSHAERALLIKPKAGLLVTTILHAAQSNTSVFPDIAEAPTLAYECQACRARYLNFEALCDTCGTFATIDEISTESRRLLAQ